MSENLVNKNHRVRDFFKEYKQVCRFVHKHSYAFAFGLIYYNVFVAFVLAIILFTGFYFEE